MLYDYFIDFQILINDKIVELSQKDNAIII